MSQAAMDSAHAPASRDVAARPARTGRLRHALRPVLMLGGIAVVVLGGGYWWLSSGRIVSVDDSYVRAAKVAVATDVSGVVQKVLVHENQNVVRGQTLLQLNPTPFRIAVAGAQAALAQARLEVSAMKADYQRMLRQTGAVEAQMQSDSATRDRYGALVRSGGVTRQQYEDARFKVLVDQQNVASLRAQAAAELARLDGNPNIAPADVPSVQAAQARLAEAQRQLRHTTIRAPFDGVVTEVEAAQPGMYLPASTAAFGLVSSTDMWVQTSPKETELTYVKPGDPVTISIDTYPNHEWHGTVASIAPASGSEFALLPAQNTTGNWVKVVQRIPLRIHITPQKGAPQLRAGMSATVDINTGHHRTLSELF